MAMLGETVVAMGGDGALAHQTELTATGAALQ